MTDYADYDSWKQTAAANAYAITSVQGFQNYEARNADGLVVGWWNGSAGAGSLQSVQTFVMAAAPAKLNATGATLGEKDDA